MGTLSRHDSVCKIFKGDFFIVKLFSTIDRFCVFFLLFNNLCTVSIKKQSVQSLRDENKSFISVPNYWAPTFLGCGLSPSLNPFLKLTKKKIQLIKNIQI
jgi:hypothetical protein